jgi:hypothetical protein
LYSKRRNVVRYITTSSHWIPRTKPTKSITPIFSGSSGRFSFARLGVEVAGGGVVVVVRVEDVGGRGVVGVVVVVVAIEVVGVAVVAGVTVGGVGVSGVDDVVVVDTMEVIGVPGVGDVVVGVPGIGDVVVVVIGGKVRGGSELHRRLKSQMCNVMSVP